MAMGGGARASRLFRMPLCVLLHERLCVWLCVCWLPVCSGLVYAGGPALRPTHASKAPELRAVAAGGHQADSSSSSTPPGGDARWLRVRECDVLLPYSSKPRAILHFVGGALAGGAPRQSYGAFLEGLADYGFVIVATPSSLLHGFNHYAAAAEVAARWDAVRADLPALLLPERMREAGTAAAAAELPPIVGVGHSLGAKLLVLISSGRLGPAAAGSSNGDAAIEELGGRMANVLLSYNNFPASRSVPLLEQARDLSAIARTNGAAVAAAVAAGLAGAGSLGASSSTSVRDAVYKELHSALESPLGGTFAQRAAEALYGAGTSSPTGDTPVGAASGASRLASDFAAGVEGSLSMASKALNALGDNARGYARGVSGKAASGMGDEADVAEFTPGAQETDEIARSDYAVRRNLLVRFTEDELDQSFQLGLMLKDRLTDPETGIGGRVDLKSLPGTHLTPNMPSFKEIDWSMLEGIGLEATSVMGGLEGFSDAVRGMAGQSIFNARAMADTLNFQQAAATALVAGFIEAELQRLEATTNK